MAHVHYNSPCTQCCYNDACHDTNKQKRREKIEQWKDSGHLLGFNSTDCFLSKEKRKRDFNNMPDWKKQQVMYAAASRCFGVSFDSAENACETCPGRSECAKLYKVREGTLYT